MSQALYRKYRSRSFDELVGQEHITRTLTEAVKRGKVSHAYLFTGPRGVGKTSIARILAHVINGLEYSDKPHLDIIEIDAASNRRIEDVRDLREKVHIAPTSAAYKVYIIDEVHMLTTESFNALLKTLEEPPSHVVFILATTELSKLPATITSRTQRFAFAPPPESVIAKHLAHLAKQENIAISPEALQLLAVHADGSFRDSISLLDQVSAISPGKGSISEENVAELLGLPPKSALESLLQSTLRHQPVAVAEQLRAVEDGGAGAAVVAAGLMRLLMVKAAESADAARLLGALVDVMRSHYPSAKLLAILLEVAHAGDTATMPLAIKPKSVPLQAPVQEIVASKEIKPTPKRIVPDAKLQTKPAPQKPTATFSIELVREQWGDILAELNIYSAPLCGTLKNAEVRLGANNALVLAFKYGLHSKKLENGKHKLAFVTALQGVTGIADVLVETVVDIAAEPTPLTKKSLQADPDASNVMKMMGGGEMVEYS